MLFKLIRNDFVEMIDEHQEDLLKIFREEMQKLDDSIPEEKAFIDIKMVPLGEEMMKAALSTVTRFIREI
jgi:hypothetical protein